MGVVAGCFATGVLVVAAQTMPFGPSIAAYSRYSLLPDRPVTPKSANGMGLDRTVSNEIKVDKFSEEPPSSPIVPVDSMLVGMVSTLSNGSLSNGQPLAAIHPDYLQEIFGQRLGLEIGARRSAPNYLGEKDLITVKGVYKLDQVEQKEGEMPAIRKRDDLPASLKPEQGQVLLVVRVMFSHDAADADGLFRFSPGNCRLVVNQSSGGKPKYTNYYPIGTLEAGRRLYANKLDDPLFVDVKGNDAGADLVYLIDNEDDVLVKDGKKLLIAPGTLLEVKRMGLVDLSKDGEADRALVQLPATSSVAVLRKKEVQPTGLTSSIDPAAVKGAAVAISTFGVSNVLPQELSVGTIDPSGHVDQLAVKGELKDKKFSVLKIDTQQNLEQLKTGDTLVKELYVPPGKQLIQVRAIPQGEDPWAWTNLFNFELVDDQGIPVHPAGAWAFVTQGEEKKMIGQYAWEQQNQNSQVNKVEDGKPTAIWFAFLMPANANLTDLRYNGKAIKDLRSLGQ
jgi:hypothetical protein